MTARSSRGRGESKKQRGAKLKAWIFAVLVTLPLQVSGQPSQKPTPAALRQQIQDRGARTVVWELSSNEGTWKTVLMGIRSGSREWLDVAVLLYRGSDAKTSPPLTDAVRDALEVAAENVLLVAADDFPLAALCNLPDAEAPRFPTLEAALSAIGKREAQLRKVASEALKAKRDKCLAQLDAVKEPLRQGFAQR